MARVPSSSGGRLYGMGRLSRLRRKQAERFVKGDSPVRFDRYAALHEVLPGALDAPSLLRCYLRQTCRDRIRPSPIAAGAPAQMRQSRFRIQNGMDVALAHRVARDAHVGVPNAARCRVEQARRDACPGARQRFRLERRLAGLAVLDYQPCDRAVVDRLEDLLRLLGHDNLLTARPDVQTRMI